MNNRFMTGMVCWFLIMAATTMATATEVDGVFGLAPMPENAALAVWVPLENDESISGVSWYNNDGSKVFPELLAVAGNSHEPALLNEAVTVGTNISGTTLGWSEFTFDQALGSATSGLFLIFRLPADGAFESEGDGSGLGYQIGDGQIRCWISVGDGEWDMLSPEYQMAVAPVMNSNKSATVLVLGQANDENIDANANQAPGKPVISGLQAAPNPFNPQTKISFTLPSDGMVKLAIFDLRGHEVRTLVTGTLVAGEHSFVWNGRNDQGQVQSSGVYLALMEAGPIRLSTRLTLVQ